MMFPGLTPVTAGTVTAQVATGTVKCHWIPIERLGRAGQAAGCSAPLLLSSQGFQDFQGSAESSPVQSTQSARHPGCKSGGGECCAHECSCRQAGNRKLTEAPTFPWKGFIILK